MGKSSEIKSRGFKSSPVSSYATNFSDEESDSENSDEGFKVQIKPKNSREKESESSPHSTQLMDPITIQYLEKNPNVKCDLLVKPKATPIVPNLLQCPSKKVKSKICKEITPESCDVSTQLMDSIEADEKISNSGQIVKAPSIFPSTQKLTVK